MSKAWPGAAALWSMPDELLLLLLLRVLWML
jgi:hypothetical protein